VTFEEFMAARLTSLLRFATVLAGDRDLAADMVQEVMVRVYQRWRGIGRLEHPDAYVRRMVLNQYLSWRRRKGVQAVVPVADLTGLAGAAADHAVLSAERAALFQRLAGLPRRQRAVLVLRYYEQLTDAEIAELLGCTPGTVRVYASRALAKLRVEMAVGEGGKAG